MSVSLKVLLMALSVFTGTFALSTAAAGNTQDVTDAGMAGINSSSKAVVIFCWNGRTATGQAEQDHLFGLGYAVSSTDRGGTTTQSDHSPTTMATDNQTFDNACIKTLTIAGALDGAMDFNSYITNGFRLDIDDAFPSAYLVSFLAIWGDDLTDAASVTVLEPAGTGNQNTTSLSFQPDAALVFGACGAINTTEGWSQYVFGAAAGATPSNYTVSGVSQDGAGTSLTCSYCRSGEFIGLAQDDLVGVRASLTAWLSNGFTLNWAERAQTNRVYRVLCLKGGRWFVGDILSQTGTSNTGETGVGFQPVALLLASHNKAQSTADTTQAQDERSIGFATASAQNYMSVIDKDASANADVGVAHNTTGFYGNQSTATTIVIEGVGGLVSLDSDGFTFAMSDADPAQAFIWYLAVAANAVAGGSLTPNNLLLLGCGS